MRLAACRLGREPRRCVSHERPAHAAALLGRGDVEATHLAREVLSSGGRARPDEADQLVLDVGHVEELVGGQGRDGAMPTAGAVASASNRSRGPPPVRDRETSRATPTR